MDDRVKQVNWLSEQAEDIISTANDGVSAEDLVGHWEEYHGVPDWYDWHDHYLMVRYVSEGLQ